MSAHEKAKIDDFDAIYRQGELSVMRRIEQRVCGCAYGATSWATRDEADRIITALGLRPGVGLLEVGAGSGWPALYFCAKSRCDVTLSDLPAGALQIALERAARDGIAARCRAVIADGARLPFSDRSFDVINQSDVLCCLAEKEKVLRECRRVVRPTGRMACSLIDLSPGLGAADYARAVEAAPDFVETEVEYPALFAATRWAITERYDLTAAFAQSCTERLRAEEELRADLEPVVNKDDLERHRARMGRRIVALDRGHLKRELFVLEAAPCDGSPRSASLS